MLMPPPMAATQDGFVAKLNPYGVDLLSKST
jgi:hypothetical protein